MTARTTTPEEQRLHEALERGDIDTFRKSMDSLAEQARASGFADQIAFRETLLTLSTHTEARVRQAVAGVSDILPDLSFDLLLGRFSADPDHYVRAAVERAAKRRALCRKESLMESEREVLITRLLGEIEERHGKRARATADRVARRSTEYFVRKFHHEATKLLTPLQFSLARLRGELDKPTLDRAAMAHQVGLAEERLALLWAIIDRARKATSTIVPRFTRVPLRPLIDRARAQLADRIGAKADRLHLEIDMDPELALDVDTAALLQALQNFLQNAVEAHPADAARIAIRVSARTLRAASLVELVIADSGVGIGPEALRDIFIPFRTTKAGGTGVGLLIARTMIEEVHGGTLQFESTEGEGTTLTVTLPARQMGVVKS